MCKTEGERNPNQDCIFPFFYAVQPPKDLGNIGPQLVTEFQGCVKNRSIGLWCPTKLWTLFGPTGETIENVYIEGIGEAFQDWGLCSPGCIKHGYKKQISY